jgi:alpha-glucosidase
MYQAIPFFLSLRPGLTYGVFLNSTYRTQFDLGYTQSDQWQMTVDAANDPALESAPELDYYLIYGSTPAEILHHYTRLTGRMPMPPKWALGYHQSRWSYESEPVVRAIAQEFRSRQLPCDVIHLDIDYMQDYRVFTWNADRFPNPAKLIQELQQAGFKVVTIVDPGIKFEPEGDYWVYQEALQKDYLICSRDGELFQGYVWSGKTVFPDFMRPEVRDWWGNGQRILTEMGVAGIWNDMNEPALNDRPFGTDGKKIPFPLDALQGPVEAAATHTETHNLYGFKMAQASYEGLGKLRSNQRSFVLTRSGYAGIQRWSSVWTGDNHSRWEHLEMSLPMLCNLGLSGVAFCGADIGGFAGNATPELFARWMQVGMLYPLMRGHSAMTCIRQEPWAFGEPVESICRTYLELRYQLLPYFYTLFWEAAKTGAPILRPLLYHYPDDPKTYTIHDQVLLGANLMAAPIYRPGQDCRAVYLPEGTWYDWWTGDRHQGSKTILVDAPLDQMPLFAKAGTILPLQPVSQFVDEQFLPALRLWVWPGTGEFTLYEDDGNTLEYQTGAWSTRTCRVYQTERQIIVAIAAQQGQWAVENRELVIELVGYGEQRFLDQGDAIEAIFEQR